MNILRGLLWALKLGLFSGNFAIFTLLWFASQSISPHLLPSDSILATIFCSLYCCSPSCLMVLDTFGLSWKFFYHVIWFISNYFFIIIRMTQISGLDFVFCCYCVFFHPHGWISYVNWDKFYKCGKLDLFWDTV